VQQGGERVCKKKKKKTAPHHRHHNHNKNNNSKTKTNKQKTPTRLLRFPYITLSLFFSTCWATPPRMRQSMHVATLLDNNTTNKTKQRKSPPIEKKKLIDNNNKKKRWPQPSQASGCIYMTKKPAA
jgi:hypothetical protein